MSKHTYKVGDRIRFVTSCPSYGAFPGVDTYGEQGTIVEFWDNDPIVHLDGYPDDHSQVVSPEDIRTIQ